MAGACDDGVPEWARDRLAVYPAAASADICDRILAAGAALPLAQGPLFSERSGERFFDPEIRLTNVGWFTARDWLFELMEGFAGRANAGWQYAIDDADPMQFAVYRRNDFFEWHKDMLRLRQSAIRKISVVLQLTAPDQYSGGRLEFLDNDHGIFASDAFVARGSVAVFSTLLKHRVTPIKRGERCSLTAWFKGPPFR